jgi:hypothetical protein
MRNSRDEHDDAEPRDQVGERRSWFARKNMRADPGGGERNGERRPRLHAEAGGVEQISSDG